MLKIIILNHRYFIFYFLFLIMDFYNILQCKYKYYTINLKHALPMYTRDGVRGICKRY